MSRQKHSQLPSTKQGSMPNGSEQLHSGRAAWRIRSSASARTLQDAHFAQSSGQSPATVLESLYPTQAYSPILEPTARISQLPCNCVQQRSQPGSRGARQPTISAGFTLASALGVPSACVVAAGLLEFEAGCLSDGVRRHPHSAVATNNECNVGRQLGFIIYGRLFVPEPDAAAPCSRRLIDPEAWFPVECTHVRMSNDHRALAGSLSHQQSRPTGTTTNRSQCKRPARGSQQPVGEGMG